MKTNKTKKIMKTKKTFFIVIGIVGMVLMACLIVGNMHGSLAAITLLVNVVFFSFTAFGVFIFFYEEWYLVLFQHMGIYVQMRPEMAAIVKRWKHYEVIDNHFAKGFYIWPLQEVMFVSQNASSIGFPIEIIWDNKFRDNHLLVSFDYIFKGNRETLRDREAYQSLETYVRENERFMDRQGKTQEALQKYFSKINFENVQLDVLREIITENLFGSNFKLIKVNFSSTI